MVPLQAKSFYLLLFVSVIAALLLVGVTNLRVDPYNVFSGQDRPVDVISRVEQFPHMRMAKPWVIQRLAPQALILGSSRSGKFPATTEAWRGLIAYNGAVPGMTSFEMRAFLEHALAQGRLRKLTLGFDFASAIEGDVRSRTGYAQDRMLPVSADESWTFQRRRLSDLTTNLFTFAALGDSVTAVAGVNEVYRGYSGDGSWVNRESPLVGEAGYRFVGRNHYVMEQTRLPGLDIHLAQLRGVLNLAYEHKLDTRILITPVHAFMLLLWEDLGRTPEWFEFHRRLVQMNVELAAHYGVSPIPLLAYNAQADAVNELIPRRRNFGEHAFLDGVHPTARLGERMMSSAWSTQSDYGVLLTPENVDVYLQETQSLARDFANANRKQVERLLQGIEE